MNEAKPTLTGLSTDAIREALGDVDRPGMRAKQIAHGLYRRAAMEFAEMPDLPEALRAQLSSRFDINPLQVARHVRSKDGVDKLLVHSGDGQVFECVLLPYADRVSCCLSSQIGCPMGCSFCATGLGGFDRNLSAAEIVGQYLLLQRVRLQNLGKTGRSVPGTLDGTPDAGPVPEHMERISRIVFMGMGEPLLNLDNVLAALRIFHDEVGLSYRHITVSTVGIVPQIRRLAEVALPIHLALSLHSPFDRIRDTFMPVNRRWPVAEVMEAMRDYQRTTGRKITLEYLLIEGLTDTPDQAAEIARLIDGVPCVVNLIPFNYVPTKEEFKRPSRNRIHAFRDALRRAGVHFTERIERGHDIAAACGQLAGAFQRLDKRRSASEPLPLRS